MKSNKFSAEPIAVFRTSAFKQEKVIVSGARPLVYSYKGKPSDTLNSLRYHRFQKKVTFGRASLHPREHPPTSAAAKFHSLRVFCQVQEWQCVELDAEKWMWKISAGGKMVPIQTELTVAPKSLLDLVRCSCKSRCCNKRCGCCKQGLTCTLASLNCRGVYSNQAADVNSVSDEYEP